MRSLTLSTAGGQIGYHSSCIGESGPQIMEDCTVKIVNNPRTRADELLMDREGNAATE